MALCQIQENPILPCQNLRKSHFIVSNLLVQTLKHGQRHAVILQQTRTVLMITIDTRIPQRPGS